MNRSHGGLSGLLAALLLACLTAHAEPVDRARFSKLSLSLVKIEASDRETHLSLGSGVVVAPEHVVTNCHVTREAEQIYILQRGLRWRAVAQAADPEHDLCMLRAPGLAAPSAPLGAARDLHVGEPVWALGFEGGLRLHMRSGIVRALHNYNDEWIVESTTPFTSGASGGALFDKAGRLAAILTYRLRGDRQSHFSVPVEWFIERLHLASSYAAVMPLPAVTPFWQRAPRELPYFMRAHQLELGQDWSGLVALSDEWAKAQAHSAEPWLFRGRGLAHTDDLPGARAALERALMLDPVSATAWLELGRMSAHRGSIDDAWQALTQLKSSSPELANCLARELTPQSESAAEADAENCSSL
jgi:serine protease Do